MIRKAKCSDIISPQDEEKEDFVKEYKTFFDDLDKYDWIAGIEDYKITEMYVAESEKSEIIGAYKNNFDVEEKSVSDVKSEIADWGKNEELKGTAGTMYKAGNNALNYLEDVEDISFGKGVAFYLESTGEIFGDYDGKYTDEFVETFKMFFSDLDEYYLAVGIRDFGILEVFIAESEDSDTVYTYGNEYDVVDMSVSDLRDKMEKWAIEHS